MSPPEEIEDRPTMKVSFCLFSYKQAAFVGDALRSVLAQDYTPLEIIVIDDGSDDGTADIIRTELDPYDGPHVIKTLLKEKNRGFADSVNEAVYTLAEGAWLVFGAGDDIFEPDRVSNVMRVAESDPRITVIQSGLRRFDTYTPASGTSIPPWRVTLTASAIAGAHGAGASYRRTEQLRFPRMDLSVANEDRVMTTRALTLGDFGIVDSEDVHWRRHGENLSTGKTRASRLDRAIFAHGRFLQIKNRALRQQIDDVTFARDRGMLTASAAARFFDAAEAHYRRNANRSDFFLSLRDLSAVAKLAVSRPVTFVRQLAYFLYLMARMTLADMRRGDG